MRKLIENSDLSPEGIEARIKENSVFQLLNDIQDIGFLLDRRSIASKRRALHAYLRAAAKELNRRDMNRVLGEAIF